jgi:hypothetical protein
MSDQHASAEELEVFQQLMKAEKDQKAVNNDKEKDLTGDAP